MSNRLLSLLTEIERVLISDHPPANGGTWDTLRLMNFNQGLARLTISVLSPQRVTVGRGIILLQHFTLADETQCLKANLSWNGTDKTSSYAIYSKPSVDWNREAKQIAAKWLGGLTQVAEVSAMPEVQRSAPLVSAAG
jgi:hypothetical protein